MGKKLGHQVAVSIGQQALSNPTYLVVESETDLPEAIERFDKQSSSVSFTDCIVMAVADRLQTKLFLALMRYLLRTAIAFQKHRINKKQAKKAVGPQNVYCEEPCRFLLRDEPERQSAIFANFKDALVLGWCDHGSADDRGKEILYQYLRFSI